MDVIKIPLELPRDLLGALDVTPALLEPRLRELIALELYREGRISSGKGAEILGLSKIEFVRLLAQHDIPYFTESSEELKSEISTLEQILGEDNP